MPRRKAAPGPAAGGSAKVVRGYYLALALVAVLAAGAYLGTLGNGFVFDDTDIVVNNEYIRSLDSIPRFFRAAWRPLKRVSLAIDYQLFGLDARGFHFTNVVWHVLATLALVRLARALGAGRGVAVIAGILFAIHPCHVESVAVITHRKEMMGALFFFLAFEAHVRRDSSWRTIALVYLWFAASILSKEIIGATLPLVILAWDAFYRGGDRRAALVQSARLLLPLIVSIGAVLVVRFVYQERPSFFPFFEEAHLREITGGALGSYPPVLATALRSFWTYCRILVLPFDLNADRAVAYSTSLTDPWALLSLAGLVACAVVVVRLRPRQPLLSFGLGFVPLTLLPAGNVLPLIPWFVAERYLYLPSAGYCLALAVLLVWSWDHTRAPLPRAALACGAMVFGVALLATTTARNRVWKDDETIWAETVRQNPDSIIAHMALLSLHHKQQRWVDSERESRAVLALDPLNHTAHVNLGDALTQLGRVGEAVTAYRAATVVYPEDGMIRNNLGNCLKRLGDAEGALEQYRAAVSFAPWLAEPHVNIGAHFVRTGELDLARQSFRRAVLIDDSLAVAHFNLAVVEQELGHVEEAKAHYRRVLALGTDPHLRPLVMRQLDGLSPPSRP